MEEEKKQNNEENKISSDSIIDNTTIKRIDEPKFLMIDSIKKSNSS